MTGLKEVALALLVSVLLALVKAEVVGRLERLPLLLLRLAARRLPKSIRRGQLEEWHANLLDEICPDTPGLPVTRLARGLRFAASALWGARRLARAVDPSTPRTTLGAYWRASARWGAAVGHWSVQRGHPRLLSHCLSYLVAGHVLGVTLVGMVFLSERIQATAWVDALVTSSLAGALFTILTTLGRGLAATLLELGRNQRWSERRIFLAHQLPLDVMLPTTIVAPTVVFGEFVIWHAILYWSAMFSLILATSYWASRKTERMSVADPLVVLPSLS